MEQLRKKWYSQRNHGTLKEGVREKKTTKNSRIGKGGGYFSNKSSENKTAY